MPVAPSPRDSASALPERRVLPSTSSSFSYLAANTGKHYLPRAASPSPLRHATALPETSSVPDACRETLQSSFAVPLNRRIRCCKLPAPSLGPPSLLPTLPTFDAFSHARSPETHKETYHLECGLLRAEGAYRWSLVKAEPFS